VLNSVTVSRCALGAASRCGGTCAQCAAERARGELCGRAGCTVRYTPGGPFAALFARATPGRPPLRRCSVCRAVAYCGAECQREDWKPRHKAECPLLRQQEQ
jgi:hypothetical protein